MYWSIIEARTTVDSTGTPARTVSFFKDSVPVPVEASCRPQGFLSLLNPKICTSAMARALLRPVSSASDGCVHSFKPRSLANCRADDHSRELLGVATLDNNRSACSNLHNIPPALHNPGCRISGTFSGTHPFELRMRMGAGGCVASGWLHGRSVTGSY